MEEKIEKAIESIAEKIVSTGISAIDTQQYAQAVLNLSNALWHTSRLKQ